MTRRLALPGVLALVWFTAWPVAGQQRPPAAPRPSGGCQFQVERIGRVGSQEVVGADTNYYGGGGVQLTCAGTAVRMNSDSVASYGSRVNPRVVFIGHVRYRDSTITMDADNGVYYRTGERWEARGHVRTENLDNGSTLEGPSLDYLRALPGVRDSVELWAVGRPTIHSVPLDSAGGRGEAYVVVADRVRMRGNDQMWAGGTVTVDRSDFAARGDSLYLNSGPGGDGVLLGKPVMRGLGRDSFELTGRRIDLALEGQVISYVTARDSAHAVSRDLDLVADTIGLDLDGQHLVQTLAWGHRRRPVGLTNDYEIRGDSLAFDTPGQQLRQVRAFGKGWVGGTVDSTTGDRDWMSGDTVVASFTQWDSAGSTRTALGTIAASGEARSFYRVSDQQHNGGLPSINYARGDQITVHMQSAGRRGVERVDLHGRVDGLNLEPLPPAPPPSDSLPPPKPARPGAR